MYSWSHCVISFNLLWVKQIEERDAKIVSLLRYSAGASSSSKRSLEGLHQKWCWSWMTCIVFVILWWMSSSSSSASSSPLISLESASPLSSKKIMLIKKHDASTKKKRKGWSWFLIFFWRRSRRRNRRIKRSWCKEVAWSVILLLIL